MDLMNAVATFDYKNFFDVVMIEKPVNAKMPVSGYGKKLPTNWMINYGGAGCAACMLTFGAMLDTVTSWLKAVNSLLCNTISTRARSPAHTISQ